MEIRYSCYNLVKGNREGLASLLQGCRPSFNLDLSRLRDPGDAYVNFRDFVPGGIIRYAGLGQVKNTLEDADCIGGPGAIDAVCGYGGNGGVVPGDAVQLSLELTHLVAGGAYT